MYRIFFSRVLRHVSDAESASACPEKSLTMPDVSPIIQTDFRGLLE